MRAWQIITPNAGTKYWLQLNSGAWAWKNAVPTEHWCLCSRFDYMHAGMFESGGQQRLSDTRAEELGLEFEAARAAGKLVVIP